MRQFHVTMNRETKLQPEVGIWLRKLKIKAKFNMKAGSGKKEMEELCWTDRLGLYNIYNYKTRKTQNLKTRKWKYTIQKGSFTGDLNWYFQQCEAWFQLNTFRQENQISNYADSSITDIDQTLPSTSKLSWQNQLNHIKRYINFPRYMEILDRQSNQPIQQFHSHCHHYFRILEWIPHKKLANGPIIFIIYTI